MEHAQQAGVGGDSEHPENHHPRSSSKERRIAAAQGHQRHPSSRATRDQGGLQQGYAQAGLDLGSARYEDALAYLIEQAALLGEAHLAFGDDVGDQHPHGYASYFFTRRALTLLEG
jgi:hypothetical protein